MGGRVCVWELDKRDPLSGNDEQQAAGRKAKMKIVIE